MASLTRENPGLYAVQEAIWTGNRDPSEEISKGVSEVTHILGCTEMQRLQLRYDGSGRLLECSSR